jgi:phospholipase C
MLSTFGGSAETLVLPPGEIGNRTPRAITHTRRPRTSSYSESSVALRAETPGPVPPAFTIPNPETLQRLDDHESVAIVMMENRSYDHFFHDLPRAYPGRGYSRPPARYRNSAPPGFKEPFAVVRNTYIGIGNSLIFSRSRRSSDPGHNYPHTMFQIGGGSDATRGSGQMRGFAADFAKESDSPQIVMSYFGMDDLPVFKALANVYPVCDRWFAALPVGTFPNRLASFQGNVPFLFNVHMDDPSLGYLEDYSIFDLLTSQDISWKFFESDIGTIRLYDRFRLDVTNVRPIGELEDTLRTASQGGSLPRVMFIEPHFLFGNDDHPPMDIQQGQRFIGQILDKFIAYGQLHKTLFVITYDEHGGFFDHVPPPGTKSSRATIEGIKYGRVESLYPQSPEEAPTCLGVRVPSLVLSKFASANANHSILDHTAIVKTLLLHNRSKIATRQFERFGKRVLKRGHLGQVLDLSSPRPIDYSALRVAIGQAQVSIPSVRSALVAARAVSMTPVHPANVLRGIALPRGRKATE